MERMPSKKGKPVILCVDDVKEVLDSLETTIKSEFKDEFKVEISESGEEGLEILEDCKAANMEVAVIISDMSMPRMLGDEFLIKAHAIYPAAAKVLLTGESSKEQIVNILSRAKLYRFISKPWDVQDLMMTVREAADSFFKTMMIEELNRQLLNANAGLEDTINERTRELLEINANKDKMINIVSHDLRSPLTGISSLADLLLDKDIAGDKAQVANYGKIIKDSCSKIVKFVEDILDLAKLESGAVTLHKQQTNLADYLDGIAKTFEPLSMTKGVQVKVNASSGVSLNIDQSKISQALNNLVGNSMKFTPKGGSITLTGSSGTHAGLECAVIEIKDTGMGIPKDKLPTIFEKFNSFQRSGTKGEKGTGLGMSIAKEVIEMHEGAIEVDSEEGKGATFTIYLPKA